MKKNDLLKAVEDVNRQAKEAKELEPNDQLLQTVVAVDDTGEPMGLIPADPIIEAVMATLVSRAIEQIEKKRLKKFTDEERGKIEPMLSEKIHDARAERDLAFYYIGAKLAQEEYKAQRKAAGIIHAAEAWGVSAAKGEKIDGVEPSKDPRRHEIVAVAGFTLDGKNTAGTTTEIIRKDGKIIFGKETKTEEMQNNIFRAIQKGYGEQKTAEAKREKVTPAERTELLMRMTLGGRLNIVEERI